MVKQKINSVFLIFLVSIAIAPWLKSNIDTVSALFSSGLDSAITQKDYANYWLGARFAVNGTTLNLYDFNTYFLHMQELFGNDIEVRAWSYPPHTLLFLWPLGFLSYKVSIITFFSVGLLMYIFAAKRFLEKYGNKEFSLVFWAAQLPFVLLTIFTMQNGLHLSALFLFGILFMHEKPLLAGLCFAIMTVKPQLGIFIPFLLLFRGAWLTVVWAIIFTILLILLSALVFSVSDWQNYISLTLPYQSGVMHNWNGFFIKLMPSLFASLRGLGIDSYQALNIHIIFAIFITPIVIWLLYKLKHLLLSSFILLIGTFLVTPYSFNYDMGSVCVICAVFVTLTVKDNSLQSMWWMFLAVICSAMAYLQINELQLIPMVLCLSLMFICYKQIKDPGYVNILVQKNRNLAK